MKRGQRGILDVVEGYVDMLFNLLAIIAAYLFADSAIEDTYAYSRGECRYPPFAPSISTVGMPYSLIFEASEPPFAD